MTGRLSTIAWMLGFAVAAFGLYLVKYEVQSMQSQLQAMRGHIAEEKENLRVLQAEWHYLNRPERLQRLAETHLRLEPLMAQQIVELSALPRITTPVTPAANGETLSAEPAVLHPGAPDVP